MRKNLLFSCICLLALLVSVSNVLAVDKDIVNKWKITRGNGEKGQGQDGMYLKGVEQDAVHEMESVETFNLQENNAYIKWWVDSNDAFGFFRVGAADQRVGGFTTKKSWNKSTIIESKKWYFSTIQFWSNRRYIITTCTKNYLENGGAVLYVKSGIMKKESFDSASNARIFTGFNSVETKNPIIKIRTEIRKKKQPSKASGAIVDNNFSIALYKTIKMGSRTGSLIVFDGYVLDLSTNLVWRDSGIRSWVKGIIGSPLNLHSFAQSKKYLYSRSVKWIDEINKIHSRGYNDWRIPTISEYSTIFKKGEGINFRDKDYGDYSAFTAVLGYAEEIRGGGPWAWSADTPEDDTFAYAYDFINEKKIKINKANPNKPMFMELIPVRTGFLDLGLLIPKNGDLPRITEQQEKIFKRIIAAYKTGLEDSGDLLFDALLNQAADVLFANNYTRMIVKKGLPLKLAGKLLLAVHDKEKNNPVFWYEYAQLAGLANQPALVLQGAKQLTKISYDGEFKEELQDQVAVFEALAYMLLGQENKAYTALLMRFDLKDNLLVPSYLNQFATPLLKDKSKLATLIGFDKQMLSGTYTVPKPQAFYNIETGKLVKPVEASPEMIKADSQPKQEEKTTTKDKASGATVLD